MNKKIYLANGLFSESDYIYNELLGDQLIALGYDVYIPQRNKEINDKTKCADSIAIYRGDEERLSNSNILVAILDGATVDPGVAAEIGYCAAKNIPIIGLYTDSRDASKTFIKEKVDLMKSRPAESQFSYANLFVVGAIKKNGRIFTSRNDLLEFLKIS